MGVLMPERRKEQPYPIVHLQDNNATNLITIKNDGTIEVDNNIDPNVEFWQGISNFLPCDTYEIIKNKLMLIKAYTILKEIKPEQNPEQIEKFYQVLGELDDYFNTAD